MSNYQNAGRSPSRLSMTVLAALILIATSLFYLNFTASRESGTHKASPQVNLVTHEPHAVFFHPESSEVVKELLLVNNSGKPVKHSSPAISFVTPPLPDVVPEAVESIMDNISGGAIESKTGSVVVIPPDAFVDVKVNPVKEKVRVSFTEYRDYKDIFFSGIPMVYYSKNKAEQFESAGMMQLEASTENSQVYLNPSKKVKVMLASNDKSSGYDLYYFNKKKGNWEEKGKDNVVYRKNEIKKTAKARIIAPFKSKARAVYVNSFDGIPEDKVFLWWRTPATSFDFSFTKINKSYPELKLLSGMEWEYKGKDAKEVYARLFNIPVKGKYKTARRGFWNSYTAEMNPETITMTVTFISEDESFPVTIRPKDRSEKNLVKVRQRMDKYNKALEARMESETNEYSRYQRDSVAYSDPEEALAEVKMEVMRSFEADNFGIWNVDRIIKDQNFISYTLAFYDQDKQPVIPTEVYLVDKNFNSVFKFSAQKDFENPGFSVTENTCRMRINPYSNCMVWMVLPGGKLAVAGQQEIWKLAGKRGKQKITVSIKEDALASIERAREQLNF